MRTFYQWLERRATPEDILSRSVPHEDGVVGRFRRMVGDRLGDLAVLALDVRLAGGHPASFAGCEAVGKPSRLEIQRLVRQIKEMAKEYGRSADDPVPLKRIEVAMEEEETAFKKR